MSRSRRTDADAAMARRIALEPQLTIEEREGRYLGSRSTQGSVERSRCQDAKMPTGEGRHVMSYSIATLLTRNLHDVFGENDPTRRRAAIDELFTDHGVFYDPHGGVYRGRDAIDRVAGALRATHPDFRYQPIAEPEALGDGGRIQWVEGRPGEAPAVAGTDIVIARDGRIAALYLFFDQIPQLA